MPALGHVMTRECRICYLLDAAGSFSEGAAQRVAEILDGSESPGPRASQWSPRRLSMRISQFWPPWVALPEAGAIHCASEAGNVAVVDLLLMRGVPADETTRYNVTPLLLAASGGHDGVLRLLLANGASVTHAVNDLDGRRGPTALHLACCSADPAAGATCVARLLQHDSTSTALHAVDVATGRTPLHLAVATGNAYACARLVVAGAWLQVADARGITPLGLARARWSEGDAQAGEVLRELNWLPAVRLLWLGQRGNGTAREGAARSDGDNHAGHKAHCSPLQCLTRDVIHLIVGFLVASHAPSTHSAMAVHRERRAPSPSMDCTNDEHDGLAEKCADLAL